MPIRVLVVDDEEDFLRSFVMRLQLRGMEAHGVTRGEEAVRFLDEHPVDAVVLDLKMPGMGGLEVLRRVGRAHPGVDVVVLTGHGSEELERAGLELGAFDYLVKPVRFAQVVERIEAAVARREGASPP